MLTGLNRIALAGSAVSVALAMAGCAAVGPDFTLPHNIDDAAYRHQAQSQSLASAPAAHVPRQWWTVFGDSELDSLQQAALQANPGVKGAAQRLLQAQAQAGVIRASEGPALSLGASVANARTSANTSQALALGGRAIEGNAYGVVAVMSHELDLWGRVRRLVEASESQAQVAEFDRDGVLLLLSVQVAQAYWQLRGLDLEMAILNDALATRRETEQLLSARLEAGLSGELDGERARVERANAEADLHEAQRQRNLLEHSLATLTGVAPSRLSLPPGIGHLPPVPIIPAGLPASLLAQRPDLAASVANLRAQNAGVGVAEAAFYPSLQLTGNLGYASKNLRDLAQGSSRQFSVGPLALSLPLFDGGRNRANLAVARARYEEALANHEGKLLTALREVEDALSDLGQRQQQGKAQAQSQQAATRALLVAQARYERGLSNYLDVIDAQRSKLAADRAAAAIEAQRLLATVALARALGGGWSPAVIEPANR